MRVVASLAILLGLAAPASTAGEFQAPDAIRVRLTEADLNLILLDAFHESGGPSFHGERQRVSRSVHGLTYTARLSEPVLDLGAEGSASVSVQILEADLRIGRIERKLIGRRAVCEDASAFVDPGRPVDVALDFQLAVEDGDLRIVPESASSPDFREAVRLVKPTRCRRTLLPTWMLWALGKPQLRKRVARLDDELLERARESAEDLARRGVLRAPWSVGDTELRLYADALDTSRDALDVVLGVTSEDGLPAPAAAGATGAALDAGSHVAISARLVNGLLGLAFSGLVEREHHPRGLFGKAFRSDAVFALIPGLRDLETTEGLFFRLRFADPPRVGFSSADDGSVRIDLGISGIEAEIHQQRDEEAQPLGTLRIDSGRVAFAPRVAGGGVVLDLLDNEWRLSSTGLVFDEPLLAATIQELVFGELFETRSRPLALDGFEVGPSRLAPRAFHTDGEWLVITLGDARQRDVPALVQTPLATRTDSPHGSR